MAERKKYIEVEIPMIESNVRVLGTPKELHNRTIKLDMTRRLRGKGLTITFRIINEKGKLSALPNKLELIGSYIRRMMRKRADYVEDSFIIKCRDIRAIIKPFLITRKKVSRAVRKNLRNTTKEFLSNYLKEKNYIELCHEIYEGYLQKEMLPKLKRIYPLSLCEIRVFQTKELEKIEFNKEEKIKEKNKEEVKSPSKKEESKKEKPVKKTEKTPFKKEK